MELMTTKEVMEYLKIKKTSLYKLAKQPGFPQLKIGKAYLFDKSEIDKWLKENMGNHILL